MTLRPGDLRAMAGHALDAVFRAPPAGSHPVGKTRGTAIVFPGTLVGRMLAGLTRLVGWKGKIFRHESGDLKNRIGPFGWPLIRAAVYEDKSWLDGNAAIILDYSKTSFLARYIRDEIREVSPGLYLGIVYWGKRRIARFMLEAPDKSTWRDKLAGFALFVGVVTLATALVAGSYVTWRLADDRPVTYTDDEDHFKYGSTGGERGYGKQLGFGIPYWIWVTMPELFPEYLPDGEAGQGYSAFGMIYESGRDPRLELPVGMSMRRVQGIDRVYFNCAVCHTGSVRSAPGEPAAVITGMPANTFDLGALVTFLARSAADWRFRSDRMLPRIEQLAALHDDVDIGDRYRPAPLGRIDRFVFRHFAIAMMREQLLTLTSRLWFIDMTSWGPGRVDTFNPPKALLGFPMEYAPERELVGNADFPAVWNQRWKRGMQLHWDGNNTSVDERNLSAAFGTGATPTTIDKAKVLRVADWLWDQVQPPAFPEQHVDAELADEGQAIYDQHCWSCHGNRTPPYRTDGDGGLVGTVTPIEAIGTDRARLDSYTRTLAVAQNTLYAGFPADEEHCVANPGDRDRCYPARFSHFRKTNGYANLPLDGLWLRAPYLHNGSVPTLRDLLEPAASRPRVFYIGHDIYDYDNVGFVSTGADAEAHGWRYSTHVRGNSNSGHEYGAHLGPDQKDALIEYLKTF